MSDAVSHLAEECNSIPLSLGPGRNPSIIGEVLSCPAHNVSSLASNALRYPPSARHFLASSDKATFKERVEGHSKRVSKYLGILSQVHGVIFVLDVAEFTPFECSRAAQFFDFGI